MARVQLTYPSIVPPAAPVAPEPAPTYQAMPTKDQRFRLFGLIPMGPGKNTPLYDTTDPAVRALYGLDDPRRTATAAAPGAPAQAGAPQPVVTPVTNYGVNDTGRTSPFNPNPTYANTTTLPMAGPTYPAGSGSPSMQGAGAQPAAANDPFSGFLGGLISLLTGKKPNEGGDQYEAALRERPADIQRLVSMSRMPPDQRTQNSGGFLGGLFDDKG